MKFDEYERVGVQRYQGLAEVVANILSASIASEPGLRPQQIQHRAKTPSSLRRKLDRDGAKDIDDVETFAKDLAGARVVFYSNSDVTRFQASRVLFDNFEVDWTRTKFHHPTTESPTANELFESNNYVVRLKEDRAKLPEYAKYSGLWCEVQVQTTLNHAWAETAHDTIYKKPVLSGFGATLMAGIENRMGAIMRNYLTPAGYEFQKVLTDFERLSKGQELFEKGVIAEIDSAESMNELDDVLEKISDYVLPHIDDYDEISNELTAAVVRSCERAKGWNITTVDTPFGSFPGKTLEGINRRCASILSKLRYQNLELVFTSICDLFLASPNADSAKVWASLGAEIAEPNIDVWRQAGPYVQETVASVIQAYSPQKRLALRSLLVAVASKASSPDLEGVSSDFDVMTIQRGTVPATSAWKDLRARYLDILDELDAATPDNSPRDDLIEAYSAFTRMPSIDPVSPQLVEQILADATRIAVRYADRALKWPFELRQRIEHSLLWLYRHHGKQGSGDAGAKNIEALRSSLSSAIFRVRDALNSDPEYVIYKVLVGFNSVFLPAWTDPSFNYEEEESYRKERISEFVASITDTNEAQWLDTVSRCAETQSDDLATFPMFGYFLGVLGEKKPHFSLRILTDGNDRLKNFLAAILGGVSKTGAWPEAESLLSNWVADGKFLSDVAFAAGPVVEVGDEILFRVLIRSIEADDVGAVFNVIRSVSSRDREGLASDLGAVLLGSVRYMEAKNEPRWVNAWFSARSGSRLIDSFGEDEVRTLLTSFVNLPQVSPHAEYLLADVAKKWPQLVIDYFDRRLALSKEDGTAAHGYSAVPYGMPTLAPSLASRPDLVVANARRWFSLDDPLFVYRGAKFVGGVFPQFTASLAEELGNYVTDSVDDLKFVVAITRAYSGSTLLHPILRDVVASTTDSLVLGAVESALHPTGVTSGYFGRLNRLKEVRAEVAKWLDDQRDQVRVFASKHLKQLDLEIPAEKRRVDQEIALRKLEYGKPPIGDGGDGPSVPENDVDG
jgi:ppGpp synthetase/RelA/SpoT-type nucleotidyltranferase